MSSEPFPFPPSSPCYFSISPTPYNHFSAETTGESPRPSPIQTPADPTHPLLAYRERLELPSPSTLPKTGVLSFFQMQTAAAHGSQTSRPRPHPVQANLQITSDESAISDDICSPMESTKSSFDLARCSRCQRTPFVDTRTGKSNMVQYGLNLWYCSRCASFVGLSNR